jgi:ribosomal protein L37AE/L43A
MIKRSEDKQMGFFDLKATCANCNKEIGLNRFQIANKEWICPECFKKCGFNMTTPINKMSVSDIKYAISAQQKNAEKLIAFKPTKKFGAFIEFDENQKTWLIPDGFLGTKKNPKIYNYSDIVDFELLEDGESITKGGLGRAITGGLLFGGIGAVVGGITGGKRSKSICNSLKIKITVNDMRSPVVYINLLATATKKDSFTYKSIYKSAQEILSTLQLICNSPKVPEENSNVHPKSNADEILKFKNLLDQGIITQEEFDLKKKQLLGL